MITERELINEYLVGICNSINAIKYTPKYHEDRGLFNLLERAEGAIHKLVDEVARLQSDNAARSEPITINLNECVKFKLTDYGKDLYYHRYDELNKRFGREVIPPRFPAEDNDGYTTMQLWDLMNFAGPHMVVGNQKLFKPLEITLCEEWHYRKSGEDDDG